jgi:5-methylcytosine-specific restriction endonuclease McrA
MPRPFNPNNYRGWRILVLKRDCKCVLCGSTERLECDHIKPFKTHPELRFDISNGRVLCHSCHKKTDTYGGKLLKGVRRTGEFYGTR